MRTITLEEHYATPAFMDGPGHQIRKEAEAARTHPQVAAGLARLVEQLCDIGEGRIANLDAAGLDVQVLSLTAPGVEQLDPEVAGVLATAAWGWHLDTAIHVLRLILSGALDRYPRLQLVIGHLGETLPFMLPRLERTLLPASASDRERIAHGNAERPLRLCPAKRQRRTRA